MKFSKSLALFSFFGASFSISLAHAAHVPCPDYKLGIPVAASGGFSATALSVQNWQA